MQVTLTMEIITVIILIIVSVISVELTRSLSEQEGVTFIKYTILFRISMNRTLTLII
jgi:hypothetical protein